MLIFDPIGEVVGDKTFGRAVFFRAQRHLIENPDDARLVEGHPKGSLIIIGKQKSAATPPVFHWNATRSLRLATSGTGISSGLRLNEPEID
jgi:hypothetical protein